MSVAIVPCNNCCVCVTGTLGSSCDYWKEVSRRVELRFPGQVMPWIFGEFMPELSPEDIMAWDDVAGA